MCLSVCLSVCVCVCVCQSIKNIFEFVYMYVLILHKYCIQFVLSHVCMCASISLSVVLSVTIETTKNCMWETPLVEYTLGLQESQVKTGLLTFATCQIKLHPHNQIKFIPNFVFCFVSRSSMCVYELFFGSLLVRAP